MWRYKSVSLAEQHAVSPEVVALQGHAARRSFEIAGDQDQNVGRECLRSTWIKKRNFNPSGSNSVGESYKKSHGANSKNSHLFDLDFGNCGDAFRKSLVPSSLLKKLSQF